MASSSVVWNNTSWNLKLDSYYLITVYILHSINSTILVTINFDSKVVKDKSDQWQCKKILFEKFNIDRMMEFKDFLMTDIIQ